MRNRIKLHESYVRLDNQRYALYIDVNTKDHKVDFENVKVLGVVNNYKKRTILEMFHISDKPNPMNKKITDMQNLSTIYTYLLPLKKEEFYDGPIDE